MPEGTNKSTKEGFLPSDKKLWLIRPFDSTARDEQLLEEFSTKKKNE
jgi:hypothetical protein